MKPEQKNEGFVLTGVLMLLLIATLVGGAFLFSARNSFATVDQWRERDDCLSAIQSGIELREYVLYLSLTNGSSIHMLDPLAIMNRAWTNTYVNNWSTDPSTVCITGITASGSVTKDFVANTAVVTITNTAWARLGKTTRKVREVITYTYSPPGQENGGDSTVFDNAFFIDNIGLFSGVNCDFNGDVYANKDMDLKYSSLKVNGDSYAGGINLSSKLYKSLAWPDYGVQSYAGIFFGNKVRPAEYTDYNKANTNLYWPQGYTGKGRFFDHQPVKSMPFIGPIAEYAAFAMLNTGSVSGVYSVNAAGVFSNRNMTAAAVWGDGTGENAGIGTNDTGCLILIGTSNNPIRLNSIFVATGDIYIKGYYTGQGTLYAGRNIYVFGDVRAVNPPLWPHPDSNPDSTAAANRTRDFLGLCAKGSVCLGDGSGLDVSMLTTPVTGSHATDISDIELGYVTHYVAGVAYFNGDYTARDGQNRDQLRSDGTPRYFYTPMISDTAFAGLAPAYPISSARVGWSDVVLYANHLIAGDFAVNAVLNGAMVCRDESIVRHGNLSMNWDIRIGSRSKDGQNFHPGLLGKFPSSPRITKIVKWTELAP
jgi:hypothetical protein